MTGGAGALLALLLAGAPDAGESPPLREQARLVLWGACGECHVGTNATALPRALGVFDLNEPDWSRRMSDPQLRNAEYRLASPVDLHERPLHVPKREREILHRYVVEEVARRAKASRK